MTAGDGWPSEGAESCTAENHATPKLHQLRDFGGYDQLGTWVSAESLYENKQLYENKRLRKKEEGKQWTRGGKRRRKICKLHAGT